jgi:hypothetical protein
MYTQQAILKTRPVLGHLTRRYDTHLWNYCCYLQKHTYIVRGMVFPYARHGHTGESGSKDPYIHLGNMWEVTGQFHTPFAYASEKAINNKYVGDC